jgi:hypothetical protein
LLKPSFCGTEHGQDTGQKPVVEFVTAQPSLPSFISSRFGFFVVIGVSFASLRISPVPKERALPNHILCNGRNTLGQRAYSGLLAFVGACAF